MTEEAETREEVRERVECDTNCSAFADPETFDEYKAAYEHWSYHAAGGGCAHGR